MFLLKPLTCLSITMNDSLHGCQCLCISNLRNVKLKLTLQHWFDLKGMFPTFAMNHREHTVRNRWWCSDSIFVLHDLNKSRHQTKKSPFGNKLLERGHHRKYTHKSIALVFFSQTKTLISMQEATTWLMFLFSFSLFKQIYWISKCVTSQSSIDMIYTESDFQCVSNEVETVHIHNRYEGSNHKCHTKFVTIFNLSNLLKYDLFHRTNSKIFFPVSTIAHWLWIYLS